MTSDDAGLGPVCAACATVNKVGGRFCRKCGAKLESGSPAIPDTGPPVSPGPQVVPPADRPSTGQSSASRGLDRRIVLVVGGACVVIALIWYAVGSHKAAPSYQIPAAATPTAGLPGTPPTTPAQLATPT